MASAEAFTKGIWYFSKTKKMSAKEISALNSPKSPGVFIQRGSVSNLNITTSEKELLTQEDWDVLLGGAKTKNFKKGDIILEEGKPYQILFQLTSGTVSLQKVSKGQTQNFGTISSPETFGETSFFLVDQMPTMTVTAESDEVTMYTIEGYFISMVASMREGFAGRFFKYITTVLARRLSEHENVVFSE